MKKLVLPVVLLISTSDSALSYENISNISPHIAEYITTILIVHQTGIKCVAAALRAEQGSREPISDGISEIREQ